MKDSIVIHNHSNEVTHYSFSAADINFFLMYGIGESYAFDDVYEYILKSTDDTIQTNITNNDFNQNFYIMLDERLLLQFMMKTYIMRL